MANRAAGKGYENVANYENVDFHFIGIENIHVMRQSLQKMIEGKYILIFIFALLLLNVTLMKYQMCKIMAIKLADVFGIYHK